MRSLLLQLLSVLCFYGLVFTTGKRPTYFIPSSNSKLKPAKEITKVAEPEVLEIKKVECIAQSVKPKSSSFTVFPKASASIAMATITKPVQKITKPKAVPQKIIKKADGLDNITQFQIATETSLREYPEQSADVLKRIGEGERVEIIESTERYWWKVNYGGRVGWVKRHLLIRT